MAEKQNYLHHYLVLETKMHEGENVQRESNNCKNYHTSGNFPFVELL